MSVPYLYIYLSSEILLGLLVTCVFLFLKNRKLTALIEKLKDIINNLKSNSSLNEISLDEENNFSTFLEQELIRTSDKIKTLDTIPLDEEDKAITESNQKHKNLLIIRNEYLNMEKTALDHNDNENTFWNHLYTGIQDIHGKFFTEVNEIINHEEIHVEKIIKKSTETVLHIEPQSKKIDAEVNKLKDIIYDQENSLSALSKALKEASSHKNNSEASESFNQLYGLVTNLERNIEESRVCMEILESENDRLQGKLAEFETKYNSMCEQLASGQTNTEPQSSENVEQLRSTLEEQNQKISELAETVDHLQLEASQAEKLKATLKEFTRGSQEMMTCITILEEENVHLLDRIDELQNNSSASGDGDTDELNKKIILLEEEIIKKDVAYAKLQDEYASMEKEYLNMYESIHKSE
ncbi:MAG: hypothetical protein OEY61_04240 [Gammaproteobacteria bacterium]|nr:hypothetical protein [Gammaproteobacteria bacterium]